MLREIIFVLKYQTDVGISSKIYSASEYLSEEGFFSRVVYPDKEIQTKEKLIYKK